jgi:hypothetical protein
MDSISDGSNVQAFVTDAGSGLTAKVENSGDGLSPLEVGLVTTARLSGYNGATWDRLRSDIANGLDVDVTRSALPTGAAAEATLATRASEATLAAMSATLGTLATEATLADVLVAIEAQSVALADVASEATLDTIRETLNDVGLTAIMQRERMEIE